MSSITVDKPEKSEQRTTAAAPRFNSTLGRGLLQLAGVVAFFVLWELGVRAGWISDFLVGAPSGIL